MTRINWALKQRSRLDVTSKPSASGSVFFREERIEKFVPPDAGRTIKRGTEVGFAPEPELFRDAPRGRVFGLAGGDNAMGLERLERMREERLACFGRIALALVRAVESPADLVGLRRKPWMK